MCGEFICKIWRIAFEGIGNKYIGWLLHWFNQIIPSLNRYSSLLLIWFSDFNEEDVCESFEINFLLLVLLILGSWLETTKSVFNLFSVSIGDDLRSSIDNERVGNKVADFEDGGDTIFLLVELNKKFSWDFLGLRFVIDDFTGDKTLIELRFRLIFWVFSANDNLSSP